MYFRRYLLVLCGIIGSAHSLTAADWNQEAGPNGDWTSPASAAPSNWSAALNQNIAWRVDLPETGQSAPIVVDGRIFLTTMKPVDDVTKLGHDISAWCFSAEDGKVLWQRDITGRYPTKLSGPFGDASSPAPVSDGKHVWFLNPTGRLACFDLAGNSRWSIEVTSVVRTRPTLFADRLILHRQVYLPDESGKFKNQPADTPVEGWTQLAAYSTTDGKRIWTTTCGVNMGCVPLIQNLSDGTPVMVVGRGGGHGPPEKPEGVSLINVEDGTTRWTLPLDGFMSTQTYPVVNDQALVFHKGEHLWVDAQSGKIVRRANIVKDVRVRRWTESGYVNASENLKEQNRCITQQSNLRVGNYHYFRCYTRNYVGRVNIRTASVEYLELPLQVLREPGQPEEVLWTVAQGGNRLAKAGRRKGISYTMLRPNSMMNSRGIRVVGDERAIGNGWGHTASPLPTAFGQRLVMPILCGMVFVLQADAEELNESAVLGINDLGTLGSAFTRSSVTTDGQRVYARTIRELMAIESKVNER